MNHCDIGDITISKFSHGFSENSTLKKLFLSGNCISNEGAKDFSVAMGNGKTRLTHLDLS